MSSSSSSSPCRNGRATASCISRILRRILCFSSLPLCTFDHFKEEEKVVIVESGCTPGLVARLMGLDSLPLIGPVEESPVTTSVDSLPRTRVRCRRITPSYIELQDDNFIILSFERRKSGKCSRRMEQSKRKKQSMKRTECLQGKNKENKEVNMASNGSEITGEVLHPLKNSCIKPEFTEDELENSSPNSVIEFVGFTADQESDYPVEISRFEYSKTSIDNGDGEKRENFAAKWDEIGKIAATETMKSSWLSGEMAINRHCLMEIGSDLETSILHHLLDELLIDLEFV